MSPGALHKDPRGARHASGQVLSRLEGLTMAMKRAVRFSCAVTLAAIVLGVAAGAQAVPVLDFVMNPPTNGLIKYATLGGPLTGAGIEVDFVFGGLGTPETATPLNNGVAATCVSCTLSFTTGNLVSAAGNQWIFDDGGNITLMGGIDFPDGTPDVPAGTTLFTGSWSSNVSVTDLGLLNAKLQGGVFTDIQNAALSAFYGLQGGPGFDWDGAFNLSFFALGTPPDTFFSTVLGSGDITNSPQLVPEPGTLILLGTALLGLGAWGRRRQQQ